MACARGSLAYARPNRGLDEPPWALGPCTCERALHVRACTARASVHCTCERAGKPATPSLLISNGTVSARADKVLRVKRLRNPSGPHREAPVVRCPRNVVPRLAVPPGRGKPRTSCAPKNPGDPGVSPTCSSGCADKPRVAVSRQV